MIIVYRDNLGIIARELDQTISIGFSGKKAYFTDTDGIDYTISVEDLIEIISE